MKFVLAAMLALVGVVGASAQTQQAACPYNYVLASPVTASTQLSISLPGAGYRFRICKVVMQITQGSTAYTFQIAAGTGSVCGTNTTQITQPYVGVISITQLVDVSVDGSFSWVAPLNNNLCLILSGSPNAANVQIWFGIQAN